MGSWGTGISSNDTYADIYEEFIDLYNKGLGVSEITKKIIEENQEIVNQEEEATNFWFAIANAQWECKALDKEILSKVEIIIRTGEDLRIWRELEASAADLKAREKVLISFLTKLQTQKDKPRKRKIKKLYNSIFKKGDCLSYKMDNNNYGGALVLTEEQQTETGTNFIAITTINSQEKPNLENFLSANVYVKRVKQIRFDGADVHEDWIDQPQIGGAPTVSLKKEKVEIEVIGQLPIYQDYKIEPDKYMGFGWSYLKSAIPFDEEYVKINGKPKLKLKLSEWTKKHWL